MTRINVINPAELTDQHLMAEYRELPMVMGSLRRSLKSKRGLPKIPQQYTLNAGHVSFFYDKGQFLYKRYQLLKDHLQQRGYHLDPARKADFSVFEDRGLNGDWVPTEEAKRINKQRIVERISAKPHWYRYYGKSIVGHEKWPQYKL